MSYSPSDATQNLKTIFSQSSVNFTHWDSKTGAMPEVQTAEGTLPVEFLNNN